MTDRTGPAPLRKQNHERALAARQRKRAEAAAMGIDEAYISNLVEQFYERIRADDMLGPIFGERIADWAPHLARMKSFWRSILLGSGEFTGNPMARHVAIPDLDARHFAQWLELFYATLRELEPDPAATLEAGGRARMIADSLLTGIALQRDGLLGSRAGDALPRV